MKNSTAAMVAVCCAVTAVAQVKDGARGANPDEAVIHDYILTMDKVRKYAEMDQKVEEESIADPSFAADLQKIEEASVRNVRKAAMIEESPRLAAFFKSNGATALEFFFTPLTVLTAARA